MRQDEEIERSIQRVDGLFGRLVSIVQSP
jgi:hypothetical protein